MDKVKINVPEGIRYLSEWEEFNFELFPKKCIVDKQIPGCGYTEWAIMNDYNVIIASPRKMLLQNKKDQHSEVFLVVNEGDRDLGVDIDLYSKARPGIQEAIFPEVTDEEKLNFRNRLFNELKDYVTENSLQKKPSKILVTYDSYYIVKEVLIELDMFRYFWTVVDEMQVVLSDSRFKSTTEIKLMDSLKDISRVHYVSATPILKQYLDLLDDFKDLPYYELDWEVLNPGRVKKPDLKVLTMKSVGEKLPEVIKRYQDGNYESKFIPGSNGEVKHVVSDEAVFYVNSVRHIISAIKKCRIPASEVNILCADTPFNQKKVRSLGKEYSIGSVPLRGEKPKKFTFCTRTVYLGADFYSECAKSYIFSDSNIDCLAVDISQDLPQILGRQRLVTNPWKNSATLYYRTTADYSKMNEEEFQKELERKKNSTDTRLEALTNVTEEQRLELVKVYKENAELLHYKTNYVAVNGGEAVFNQYAYVADIRAFDIQQKDYADRFTVFSEITRQFSRGDDRSVAKILETYVSTNQTFKRLQILCEFFWQFGKDKTDILLDQVRNDDPVKEVFMSLSPDRCRANGYKLSDCRKELGLIIFDRTSMTRKIYQVFQEGQKLEKSYIKVTLQGVYEEFGYKGVAKAINLGEWFDMREAKLTKDGKRVPAFELVKKKIIIP